MKNQIFFLEVFRERMILEFAYLVEQVYEIQGSRFSSIIRISVQMQHLQNKIHFFFHYFIKVKYLFFFWGEVFCYLHPSHRKQSTQNTFFKSSAKNNHIKVFLGQRKLFTISHSKFFFNFKQEG